MVNDSVWNVRQVSDLITGQTTHRDVIQEHQSPRGETVYCFHTSPHAFTFQMELPMQTDSVASTQEDPKLKAALFEISLPSGRF